MTQLTMEYPAAVVSRASGRRMGASRGPTLRQQYIGLLRAAGAAGLTDHEAGRQLGALSTTIGARRGELMAADPGCIEPVGRVPVDGGGTSRTAWRWTR